MAGLHAKASMRFLEKIGEYKWDMEMTTEADTADTAAEEAADAAASEEAVAAVDTAAHAK